VSPVTKVTKFLTDLLTTDNSVGTFAKLTTQSPTPGAVATGVATPETPKTGQKIQSLPSSFPTFMIPPPTPTHNPPSPTGGRTTTNRSGHPPKTPRFRPQGLQVYNGLRRWLPC